MYRGDGPSVLHCIKIVWKHQQHLPWHLLSIPILLSLRLPHLHWAYVQWVSVPEGVPLLRQVIPLPQHLSGLQMLQRPAKPQL